LSTSPLLLHLCDADPKSSPTLTGGVLLKNSMFESVLMHMQSRNILRYDLTQQISVEDLGDLKSGAGLGDCANMKAELFRVDTDTTHNMHLERYMNINKTSGMLEFLQITSKYDTDPQEDPCLSSFTFAAPGADFASWQNETDLWLLSECLG
jgi:hypothetical protein